MVAPAGDGAVRSECAPYGRCISLVMRRFLVAAEDMSAFGAVAACFGVEKELHLAGEQGDFGVLPGDDGGEIVGDALQMGDFFFKRFHAPAIHQAKGGRKVALPREEP